MPARLSRRLYSVLVQIRTAVSIFYLSPPCRPCSSGQVSFWIDSSGSRRALRPRWLLSAAVGLMIFADGAPTLISQYRDGKRYDFRGASRWLDERMATRRCRSSRISPKWWRTICRGGRYGDWSPTRYDSPTPRTRCTKVAAAGYCGSSRRRRRTRSGPTRSYASLNDWIYGSCQLRNTLIGVWPSDRISGKSTADLPVAPVAAARPGGEPTSHRAHVWLQADRRSA